MFFWCVKNKQIMLGRHRPSFTSSTFFPVALIYSLLCLSLSLSLSLSLFLPIFCIKNYVVYAHFIVFVLREIAPG